MKLLKENKNEKVTLYYDYLPIHGTEREYEYEADKDNVSEWLVDYAPEDLDDEDAYKYVDDNFDKLLNDHYDEILNAFEDRAIKEAEENISQDDIDSVWESDYDDDLYESKTSNMGDLKKKLYEAIDNVLKNFKSTPILKENTTSNNTINKEQPKQTQSMLGNIQWWDESLNNNSISKNNVDLYTNDINVDDEM